MATKTNSKTDKTATTHKTHAMTTPTKPATKSDTPKQKTDLIAYFKGVKTEWGKINWPTKAQIVSQTIVVLLMVTIVTIGIWLTDRILHDGILCNIIPNGAERCQQH